MLKTPVKAVHSFSKLLYIVVLSTIRVIRALVRGDLHLAAEATRVLAWTVLQDCTQGVVLAQRVFLGSRVSSRDIERVLVIKLDRIGDMVNTTPVFDALRQLFPRARVDLLAHPGSLELLKGDERIGERIAYRSWLYHSLPLFPPGLGTFGVVVKLLCRRYPLVVFLRGSYSFLLLGLTSRLAAFKFVPERPIVDQLLRPLESLYGPVRHSKPRLKVDPDLAAFGRGLLNRADGRPCIVIHANSIASTRTWPLERFAALADELGASRDACVHFLGSPVDAPLFNQINRLASRSHSFHAHLSLGETIGVIASCDLFIGNDSGLSHIAAATARRMIVIWGSASLAVSRPSAPLEDCIILHHDLPCRSGCTHISCHQPIPFECLMRTQTHHVLAAVERLLGPASRARNHPLEQVICH